MEQLELKKQEELALVVQHRKRVEGWAATYRNNREEIERLGEGTRGNSEVEETGGFEGGDDSLNDSNMEVRVSDSADDGNESIGEGGCTSVSEGGRGDGGGAAGRGAEQERGGGSGILPMDDVFALIQVLSPTDIMRQGLNEGYNAEVQNYFRFFCEAEPGRPASDIMDEWYDKFYVRDFGGGYIPRVEQLLTYTINTAATATASSDVDEVSQQASSGGSDDIAVMANDTEMEEEDLAAQPRNSESDQPCDMVAMLNVSGKDVEGKAAPESSADDDEEFGEMGGFEGEDDSPNDFDDDEVAQASSNGNGAPRRSKRIREQDKGGKDGGVAVGSEDDAGEDASNEVEGRIPTPNAMEVGEGGEEGSGSNVVAGERRYPLRSRTQVESREVGSSAVPSSTDEATEGRGEASDEANAIEGGEPQQVREELEGEKEAASDTGGGDQQPLGEELWDLKMVLPAAQINSENPTRCSGEGCNLVACTIWSSNHDPKTPWNSCLDCQEEDFGHWSMRENESGELEPDLPNGVRLEGELWNAMTSKCTRLFQFDDAADEEEEGRLDGRKNQHYAVVDRVLKQYVHHVKRQLLIKHGGDEDKAMEELLAMKGRGEFRRGTVLPCGQTLLQKVTSHPQVTPSSIPENVGRKQQDWWKGMLGKALPYTSNGSILKTNNKAHTALETLKRGEGPVEAFGENTSLWLDVLQTFKSGSDKIIPGEHQ